jgi:hypothetical protein
MSESENGWLDTVLAWIPLVELLPTVSESSVFHAAIPLRFCVRRSSALTSQRRLMISLIPKLSACKVLWTNLIQLRLQPIRTKPRKLVAVLS